MPNNCIWLGFERKRPAIFGEDKARNVDELEVDVETAGDMSLKPRSICTLS